MQQILVICNNSMGGHRAWGSNAIRGVSFGGTGLISPNLNVIE